MATNATPRDSLLLRLLPDPNELATYRTQVAATIEKNRKRNRLERFLATPCWVVCAALATIYMWFGTGGSEFPRSPFLACIFLILGDVEILKHHLRAAQVDLHKEVKQLQLQVLELQSALTPSCSTRVGPPLNPGSPRSGIGPG